MAASIASFERPYVAWFISSTSFGVLQPNYEERSNLVSHFDNIRLSTHRLEPRTRTPNVQTFNAGEMLLAPDGRTLVVRDESGSCQLWNLRVFPPLRMSNESMFQSSINGVDHFSNDGRVYGALGNSSKLQFFDCGSGEVRTQIVNSRPRSRWNCFEFSADDSHVAIGSENGSVEVWRIR
jgi:WD40 repeat protein